MRSFKKLLKGITGNIISVFVLAIIVFILVLMAGVKTSFDSLIGLLLFYMIFMVLACVAMLIYGILIYCTYDREKDRLMAITGFSAERFERETAKSPPITGVLLCSDAICYRSSGYFVKTIPIADIVWAYQDEKQGLTFISIYTKDKSKYSIPVSIKKKYGTSDMACRYILRLIARKNKCALIGYNDSYEAVCKNNFDQLLMKTRGGEIIDSGILEQEYIQNNYYEKDLQ